MIWCNRVSSPRHQNWMDLSAQGQPGDVYLWLQGICRLIGHEPKIDTFVVQCQASGFGRSEHWGRLAGPATRVVRKIATKPQCLPNEVSVRSCLA